MAFPRNNKSMYQTQVRRNRSQLAEEGFTCVTCGLYVPNIPLLSGVQNRNHCPSCLHSRHLDSLSAGDRRSGCRAAMEPIGLTTKRSRNKYAQERDGELMIIHRCTRCRRVVINRVAADDSVTEIFDIFARSSAMSAGLRANLEALDITPLAEGDDDLVRRRLLGNRM